MKARLIEVPVSVERNASGEPVIDKVNGQEYCRFAWQRGAGPPTQRGVYLFTTSGAQVLYVGKATSDTTSHLYRRLTAYKRASHKKTQWTSLRVNALILDGIRTGQQVRLFCLTVDDASADSISQLEERLISAARPPWNRQLNPRPRSRSDALPLADVLEAVSLGDLAIPTQDE